MKTVFERNALYDEVWTSPLTKLAAKYNLSDNGLRKVCKALNIPLPVAGYWAKVAAGQMLTRTPLPSACDRTTFTSDPTVEHRRFGAAEDDEWLAERMAYEALPANQCVVDIPPKRWHPVVAPFRDKLREAVREVQAWHQDFVRGEKNPRFRQSPGYSGGHWPYFCDKGEVLIDTHKPFPVRVSQRTYERALAILNALCFQSERRGFKVSLDEENGRFVLAGHSGRVEARISEKLLENWRSEVNSWSKKPENVKFKTPSGVLRLYVGKSYAEKEIADAEDRPLEAHFNSIFCRIYGRVIRAREDQREHDHREREWKVAEERREAEERRRQEEAARREAERKKREGLIAEAQAWKTATLIRDYVDHVTAGSSDDSARSTRDASWATWARRVADEMDPTAAQDA